MEFDVFKTIFKVLDGIVLQLEIFIHFFRIVNQQVLWLAIPCVLSLTYVLTWGYCFEMIHCDSISNELIWLLPGQSIHTVFLNTLFWANSSDLIGHYMSSFLCNGPIWWIFCISWISCNIAGLVQERCNSSAKYTEVTSFLHKPIDMWYCVIEHHVITGPNWVNARMQLSSSAAKAWSHLN